MKAKSGPSVRVWLALLTLTLGLASAAPSAAAETGSYGYIRTLEGSATLMQAGSGDRDQAEINQPLLSGDRLWVPDGSRAELVLADRNLLRVDGGTELQLERLAGSPDTDHRATVLRLHEGNLQLVVLQDSLGEELPRIETPSATIYVQHYGVYRVTADRDGWSEVLVRRGKAEVVTDRGTANVKADERATIDSKWATVNVGTATGYDKLERWAQRLDEDFEADVRYVDDDLRYDAAPLSRHGSWVQIESRRYWRPRVDTTWRPYWRGRWVYTPSGMTWVSNEPWGWVPYHYGTWDYFPAYGWVWEPGYVYSPAWVYWYWGPGYASWCPTGYYTRYYGPRFGHGYGFRNGVYGWAGGGWDHWRHWNWVRTDHIGRRDQHRYAVPVDELRGRLREVPRGIITTDTQGLKPDTWRDQGRVARVLHEKPNRANPGRELPDVTPFIERKPQLPPTVARNVIDEKPMRPTDGTPLRPSTLGRKPAGGRMDTPVARIDPDKPLPVEEKPRPRTRITNDPTEVGGTDKPAREPRARAGRPAPGTDGGAPRPDRSARGDVDGEKPASPGVGGSRPSTRPSNDDEGDRSTRGSARPARPDYGDDEKPSRVTRPERSEPRDEPAPRAEPETRARPEAPVREEKPRYSPPPSNDDGDNDRSPRRVGGDGDGGTGYDKPSRRPPSRSDSGMERMSMPQSRPTSRPTTEPIGRERYESPRSYSRPETSRPSARPETRREEPTSRRSVESARPSSPPPSERPRVESPSRSSRPSYSAPRGDSSGGRSGGDRGGRAREARPRGRGQN